MTTPSSPDEVGLQKPIPSESYFLVVMQGDGTRFMNNLGKRCSWERALRACEDARRIGAVWAVVFGKDGLFMAAVTPWENETTEPAWDKNRDAVVEAAQFRAQSLELGARLREVEL